MNCFDFQTTLCIYCVLLLKFGHISVVMLLIGELGHTSLVPNSAAALRERSDVERWWRGASICCIRGHSRLRSDWLKTSWLCSWLSCCIVSSRCPELFSLTPSAPIIAVLSLGASSFNATGHIFGVCGELLQIMALLSLHYWELCWHSAHSGEIYTTKQLLSSWKHWQVKLQSSASIL